MFIVDALPLIAFAGASLLFSVCINGVPLQQFEDLSAGTQSGSHYVVESNFATHVCVCMCVCGCVGDT